MSVCNNLCPSVATVAIVLIYCDALAVYVGDPTTFPPLELKHLTLMFLFLPDSFLPYCCIRQ